MRGGGERRAYQGHTPNIVAFTVLMRDVHDFVADHGSPPIAFCHDLQEEFAAEMRRTYETFGAIRYKDHPPRRDPDNRARGIRPGAVLHAVVPRPGRLAGSRPPRLDRATGGARRRAEGRSAPARRAHLRPPGQPRNVGDDRRRARAPKRAAALPGGCPSRSRPRPGEGRCSANLSAGGANACAECATAPPAEGSGDVAAHDR